MLGIAVIPTYNERENLLQLIEKIWFHCPQLDVLVVDDNSPDGTGVLADQIAEQHPGRVRVLHRARKEGLGRAYVDGIGTVLELDYDFLIQMDADHSHNPAHIPAMIAQLETCDLVVGSRYRNGTISVVGWDLKRLILSKFATAFVRTITGMRLSDATSGFRCWRVSALRDLGLDGLSSTGYLILVEMAYWAWRRGLRIAEVSITFEERRFGDSKISLNTIQESVVGVFLLAPRYRKQNRGVAPLSRPRTTPSDPPAGPA